MKLNVNFSESKQVFDVKFRAINDSFEAKLDELIIIPSTYIPEYVGPYEVVPKMETQVLPTKEKLMRDDVTIKEVPVFRVSNNSGGTTVYIAREV